MSNNIHKTAIIGSDVIIGENNTIGPHVVIEGKVSLGSNNIIGPNTMISNNVKIGDHNRFVGNASIGALGEMGTKGDIFVEDGCVQIGNHNVFREFMTINSPVRKKITSIGNNGYFMARTHIPHDAEIKNNVVMATNSLVGGGSVVFDFAYLGLGSITHQWIDIGESAMIGMQAATTKHVPPFCIITGVPSRIFKFNRVGAERRGFDTAVLDEVDQNFQQIILGEYSGTNEIITKIKNFISNYPDCLKSFLK